MSDKTQAFISALRQRLQAVGRRQQLAEFAWGGIFFLGSFAAIWLLVTAVEAGFWLDTTFRTALFWSVLLVALALAYRVVVRPLLRMLGWLRGPSEEQLARQVGQRFPEISDRFTNLLQLADGRTSPSSPAFIDHAVASLGRTIEPVPFEGVVSFDRVRMASRLALIPVAGVLVFLLAAPGAFLGASHRLLAPGTHFNRPSPFQLSVEPGDIALIRGDSLTIRTLAAGTSTPAAATLEMQLLEEEMVTTEVMRADSARRFEHRLLNVRHSFRYRVRAGEYATPWYTAEIAERPLIRALRVALSFPRYARIPPQRLDPNVGDVQALAGTSVQLAIDLSGPDVAAGYIVHDDGRRDTLDIGRASAEGAFTVRREGSYHLLFVDERGITNSDPIEYTVRVVQDARPQVLVVEPEPVSELNDALATALRIRLTDDFGFSRLALNYRLAESRFGTPDANFSAIPLTTLAPFELDQEILHAWDLRRDTPLDPIPGDVIEFFVQVWDNDAFAGFKDARSATLQLRLPSLAEQYEQLDKTEDAAQEEMEEMLDEARQIREQFEELRDELRNKQESDWEDQRQLEQVREKQSAIEQRADELNQAFDEMIERMEENDLASERTLEMYQEMQKVIEEINSPELMEALNQLQEAMQELDLQQMQDALQDFEFNEKQYQERLERTLDLFKQLRVQQDLEEAARRAEDLAEQQEQISKKTEELRNEPEAGESPEENDGEQQDGEQQDGEQQDGEQQDGEQQDGEQQDGEQQDGDTPREQLAKQQELSSEEMKQLESLLEQIQERMDELKQAPTEEMERLNEQVQDEQLPQQMQENAEQLRQNELQSAQQQQQQMQQQLQQMQQQLQQMQQGMEGSQIQINIAALRRALSDILTLSHEQEQLINEVRALSPDSPALRQFAQAQVELGEGAAVVSDSLQKLARDIPNMTREVQQQAGEALRAMGLSTEAMTERQSGQATAHQKSAMMHLNELALLLTDLLDQMMNMQSSGSGSGMSMQQMTEQLQNAAQKQQQLNQQIQQMLNQMQGDRLSPDMQDRLRQMAAQQESIRAEIKNLSRNPEMRGKMMGDLNKIAEQMEETIQELQRGQPGRRTQERQQQILTRLLDATRSMQERGRENRREGRIGEPTPRDSPGQLPASKDAESLRRALIEALESGYSPDYEDLIKRYFDLLQRSTDNQP